MIRFKVPGIKSWLDPKSSLALSADLQARLVDRLAGKRALFITLTYRHNDYSDPRDLYRCASEEQHIPMFFRRLSRELGISLKGRWLCKREFQQGGWLHYHIVFVYNRFISSSILQSIWDHGFVSVKRYDESCHSFYLSKYMAKDGSVPDWLLLEKPRSVKIVSVSPGFWDKPSEKKEYKKYHRQKFSCYQPIGYSLEKARKSTLVDDHGHVRLYDIDITVLIFIANYYGFAFDSDDTGWLYVDCTKDDLSDILFACRTAGEQFNLINKSNPDSPPPYITQALISVLKFSEVA